MAKSKGIDLSKFKHVSSDKNSTRLRHEDGHFLVIARKGVKGDLAAHLDALSANSSTSKMGQSAKDAQDSQDKAGYADGGEIYGARDVDAKIEAEKHPAATSQAPTRDNGVDVRTEDQKARAEAAKVQYGYAKGGEIDGAPPAANSGEYKPNSLKAEPYSKPSTERTSEGTTKPQDTRSTSDKVRDVGHNFKDSVGATYGNYADGGPVDSVVPDYKTIDPNNVPPASNGVQQPLTDQDRLKQLYQDQVTGVSGNPFSLAKGLQAPDNDQAYSPDGAAPKQVNVDAAQKAQQELATEKANNAAQGATAQQSIIQQNQARAALGLEPLPVPDIPNGQQVPGSEMNPQTPGPDSLKAAIGQTDPMSAGMDAQANMLQSGYNKQMAGINAQAQASGALGEQQANLLNENIKAQQSAQATYQQHFNELEQERQAHMKDIQDGHIDPQQYWTGDKNGNGSHSKIASAIGMILAGFNPTNRPNAAIEMLNHQMEQNLNAQKENLNSKQNLLTANIRQFGNLKDATDMTRLMQSDIIQNELKTAAAKAQSPMAKAAALQAAGQLQMQYAPLQQQMAMRTAMMKLANEGAQSGNPSDTRAAEQMIAYARMTNPEMAKEMESRLVPGVGMGKVPVPEAVRTQLVSGQKLQNAATDLLSYAQTHSNIIPGTPDYNVGVQKSMILQQMVREGMLGTVFRESEKPLLDKFVNENPAGALKAFSTEPKLKTIIESNMSQMNTLKSQYGLPTKQAQVQQTAGSGMEGKTATNAAGQRIVFKSGRWQPVGK